MKHSWTNPDAGASVAYNFPVGDELRGERATLGKSLLDVQRDLRIKAAHIAAIEDSDLDVFANRGVIPGYVRSYARYLGRDPEEIFRRFREETGFTAASFGAPRQPGGGAPVSDRTATRAAARAPFPDFPLAPRRPRFGLPAIPFSAIGSLLVMAGLVAGLGYGGWTVLRNIQRVQFAPVEEVPVAVAELSDMEAPSDPALDEPALSDLASPVTATALTDLYRDQEASVPILVPRDGPIAAINPDRIGPLAGTAPLAATAAMIIPASQPAATASDAAAEAIVAQVATNIAAPVLDSVPAAAPGTPAARLTVVAERAAWIRVYLDTGTILFERILEKGETYTPPEGVGAPLIWAGNSGSVYVRVDGTLRGPLGSGTRAARDVSLDAVALAAKFPVVEQVPEVISQSLGTDAGMPAAAPVSIQ